MTIAVDPKRHADSQPVSELPVADLRLDHVELYVEDLDREAAEWTTRFGFAVVGSAGGVGEGFRSLALRQGRIVLVLTEGTDDEHEASLYTGLHGSGVARIVLRTADMAAAFAYAVSHSARPLTEPVRTAGPGVVATATISGFGDVVHTLIEREGTDILPQGFEPVSSDAAGRTPASGAPALEEIDHFAVCVNVGELEEVVTCYREALGFKEIFEERIAVGSQAMLSKVVQSREGDITFTIIQPDPEADPGQIDDFLKNHGGAGVQHIAFSSPDAVGSVRALAGNGVELLKTPGTYYQLLAQRMELRRHGLEALREWNLLVDEDHGGQLFQIFTRSTHARRTLFFEVIERLGAETFGSSNIKALYEAVELERLQQNASAR
ncbi:4-hydroxyphenylpyruvate dioxygenase [Streptomyces sp. NPDC051162]|uniref:4-hydroxyphenylpyruvate dioxygenase n=1 Tax=Streptomyces sp. NPDC051162 TaxID=3154747 RepID=UPI00342C8DD8